MCDLHPPVRRFNGAISSCQVQYDLCRSYVDSQGVVGWIVIDERFDDEGESGAALNRPALQRLLARTGVWLAASSCESAESIRWLFTAWTGLPAA